MYLGTDAIADRDLGFALARRSIPAGASSGPAQTETSNSVMVSQPNASTVLQPAGSQIQNKRAASPEPRKRDEGRGGGPSGGGGGGSGSGEYSSGHKRARAQSPNRERERWDGPPRRRFSPLPPPSWDRDEHRGGGGQRRGRDGPRGGGGDRDEERGGGRNVQLPHVLSWFIGELPTPASFDGMLIFIFSLDYLGRVAHLHYRPCLPDGRSYEFV